MKHGIKALLITLSLACAGMSHKRAGGSFCGETDGGRNQSGSSCSTK